MINAFKLLCTCCKLFHASTLSSRHFELNKVIKFAYCNYIDQISRNKLSYTEFHVHIALSTEGYFAVWTLTTDVLFTKTQEQTVGECGSKLQSYLCVCTWPTALIWTICQNKPGDHFQHMINISNLIKFSFVLHAVLMQVHHHGSRAFSLSAPTLTADIYSSCWDGCWREGQLRELQGRNRGSKYTPPHRPAPPAPAPVEIDRAESSAAQKQVWDGQQKLNSSPFPSAV